ncbi:unnamed protein product [Gemmata massiliana]|uniref:Uncharacterized protein n=1 Tax=Gemmata massiliana TaxID=1210884 RepID=A0A6P2CU70_9BACT|nr:hypothetical protein [Gemmata massiliana]VTR91695.1 unnamed protein product [Gemmata massiliana]
MSATWAPTSNSIHRLLQYLDVLAIAFNRFRQRSFELPVYRPPDPFDTVAWQEGVRTLLNEFDAVRNRLFAGAFAPARLAERLVDETVAEFARCGGRDDSTLSAIADAAVWIGHVGTPWNVGTPRPWNYGSLDPESPTPKLAREERFEAEFQVLERYSPVRAALTFALARTGQSIPPNVHDRRYLTYGSWAPGQHEPISQRELLALANEAASAPRPPGDDERADDSVSSRAARPPKAKRRRGNRSHAQSRDPKRRFRANLFDNIFNEKRPGEGAQRLAQRLSKNKALVELAKQAGFDAINAAVVESAIQYSRRRTELEGPTKK